MKIYLAGPIDNCHDAGKGWRDKITPLISKYGEVLHPVDIDGYREIITQIKGIKPGTDKYWEAWQRYKEVCQEIADNDYDLIDEADVLVAVVDMSVSLCGTYMEIAYAESTRTPIIIYTNGTDFTKLPVFMVGTVVCAAGSFCKSEKRLCEILGEHCG